MDRQSRPGKPPTRTPRSIWPSPSSSAAHRARRCCRVVRLRAGRPCSIRSVNRGSAQASWPRKSGRSATRADSPFRLFLTRRTRAGEPLRWAYPHGYSEPWRYVERGGGGKVNGAVEKAIFAGGCFWGMQDLIRARPGVVSTRVGYTGGDVPNATYRNHGTHAEAIEITFDPEQTSYRDLLAFFFQIHDPTTLNRQGNDVGMSYRSAIFY